MAFLQVLHSHLAVIQQLVCLTAVHVSRCVLWGRLNLIQLFINGFVLPFVESVFKWEWLGRM